MSAFSCVLIGDESLLVGCADALLDRGHTISAIVSGDPVITGWAVDKGLRHVERIADLAGQFDTGEFDYLLSIANLKVIPEPVLALPARGAVNFHDGPLPRYAGLNAPVWALMNGERDYGVSWHMLEGGIDEGDLIAQALFEIAGDDTAFSLNSKCYAAAMDSFGQVIAQLESGAPERQPQDLTARSYFGRFDRPVAAGRLDVTRPADELAAQVRALDFGDYWNPMLRPKIELGGQVLLVGHAAVESPDCDAAPGTILENADTGLVLATGSGSLQISGFTDKNGAPVDAVRLAAVGSGVASADPDTARQLTELAQKTARADDHWRARLQQMAAIRAPLAGKPTETPDWSSRDLHLPQDMDRTSRIAAALVWALRSSDQPTADIALASAASTAQALRTPGYISRWVPLQVDGATPIEALRASIDDDLARLDKLGAFATDLIARDPQIVSGRTPDIAVDLSTAGPVEGSALTVSIENGTGLRLHFDRARIDDATAKLLGDRLIRTAELVCDAAMQSEAAGKLDILPQAERDLLLSAWNATASNYDDTLTIHRAFEAQAARTPDATALVFEDQALSYAALNARANAIAAELRVQGAAPGTRVGLYLRRSVDMLAGALGILKAGAAYVPMDPDYPEHRLAHYLTDSAATLALTSRELQDNLPASDARTVIVNDITVATGGDIDGGATADDLAYVIYTSGSTGTPKGVMVEHGNVSNFFTGMDAHIDHAEGGVWMAVTSLSFDISVLELFYTLARGFKVVLSGDGNRAAVSNGPIAISDRHMDFGLMYWGNDDGPGRQKYNLLLEGAKFADANGFNSIWTPERHFHAFGGPYPNPSVSGAAVAAVTRNLHVRSGSVVAPLHHPARIAEDWAMIDNLTDGRAGLGIASGWQPHDFVLRPENAPPNNKTAMFDAIDKLRKLWRGEAVEFPMNNGEMHAVTTLPRPVSKELPLWVTIAGNPDTWREAGEIGANVLTHLLGQSVDEVGEKIKIYHAALREAGHDPDDFTVTVMLHTYLADTREEAEEVARGPMKAYLTSAAGLIKQFAWVFPAFKRPKGVNNPFELDLGDLEEEDVEAILEFAFLRYFEDSGMFGTVEDGIARAEQLKRIGVGEIACLIDYGIAPDKVLESLEPLAEVIKGANRTTELAADDFSLAAQVIRHDVTHLQCTPSMAQVLLSNDEARAALAHVKHMALGGEALPGELVDDLRGAMRGEILNLYGPTETTIWSSAHLVEGKTSGTVSIGKPITNTALYVLDADQRPVPVGVPGELYIGGAGVTRGYWQDDAKTAVRFLPDPFAGTGRIYRTGDMVRWDANGTLDYLGRADHQVKIRGQRIELGEIEACLAAVPGVTGAVVTAREMAANDLRLVAYVTASGPVSEEVLRQQATGQLPEVMVPSHFVTLDRFPLTPNQKIDRAALPDPAQSQKQAPRAPATLGEGAESIIAAIWSRTLGVAGIRPDDNFFQLGGHSLLAVQAHREIRSALNAPGLSITDIFRYPTLRALAEHVSPEGASVPDEQPPVADKTETMSRRKAMRAGRARRAG